MGRGPAHHGRGWRSRRGITFLEVVFATVILAMTIATLAATVNSITIQQNRSRQLLNCAEIANRLVIQYLDDRNALPNEDIPLQYGDEEYRWHKNVTRVVSTLDPTVERNLEDYQDRQSGSTPDRLTKVAVTVWLSESSGGARLANQGAPQSTIVRIVDPLALTRRSPDTLRNRLENNLDDVLRQITGNDDLDEEEDL